MKTPLTYIALLLIIMTAGTLRAAGQNDEASSSKAWNFEGHTLRIPVEENKEQSRNKWQIFRDWCEEKDVFNHLSAGVTVGSTGIGLEVSTPVTKWVDIRAGVAWLPRFTVPMSFNLNTYSDGLPTGNFNRVSQMLYDMTGIYMDETVHMKGKGSMVNFKFMVDVYPFQNNRHWHFTAGFYAGTSQIAKAINTYEEKPTLVGLNIYNRAYDYFTNLKDIYDVPLGGGAYLNPEVVEKLQDRFRKYGEMGIYIGDFSRDTGPYKAGDRYIMTPAPDGTVSAKAFVNRFKPYLGAGYSTALDKKERWQLSVDLGAMFWGGAPNVINHDYATGTDINFTKDLKNIRGKVGDYMKIIKGLPVYPVLEIRISYNIL